jgi:hypothetical protein
VTAALGAATLLAACSSGGGTGSTAGPSASQPDTPAAGPSASCTQITALRTALTNVTHITVSPKTGSQVSADLTSIETALTALKRDAPSVFSAEASQVVENLSVLSKQAQLLSLRPTALNRRITKAAVRELQKTVSSVTTEMRLACP